jgi:subtilisin family serine protease
VDQARKYDDINQVKVCILDTGIDDGHLHLTDPARGYAQRIKGCIAWNKDNELQTYPEYSTWRTSDRPQSGGYEDEDGHGTHCASLILEVAPNSHLYLARVTRNRNERIDPSIVAKVMSLIIRQ